MKKYTYFLVFTLSVFISFSQRWEWAKIPSLSTGGNNVASTIRGDGKKNIYLLGWVNGNMTYGSTTLQKGPYLCKYDSAGNFTWARNLPYQPTAMQVDQAGNIYMGTSTWEYMLSGNSDTLKTDNTQFVTLGDHDIAVIKLNASGTEQWARRFGGMGNEGLTAMKVDRDGNVYLTGFYLQDSSCNYSLPFDSYTLQNTSCGAAMFVAKLNTNGQSLWASAGRNNYGTSDYDISGHRLSLDPAGNIFVYGFAATSPTSTSEMIAGFDHQGNMNYHVAKSLSSAGVQDFAASSNKEFVFTGPDSEHYKTAAYLNKVDSLLQPLWKFQVSNYDWYQPIPPGAKSEILELGLNIDKHNCIYLTGSFGIVGDTTGGPYVLQGAPVSYSGGGDLVIRKYSPQGNVLWSATAGCKGIEHSWDLFVDDHEDCYIAGVYLNNHISCDVVFNTDTLHNNQQTQDTLIVFPFVAKLTMRPVSPVVGFSEESRLTLKVYPVPSAGKVTIEGLEGNGELKVSDQYGRIIHRQQVRPGFNSIDLAAFPNGIYFGEVSVNGQTAFVKFVIDKGQ